MAHDNLLAYMAFIEDFKSHTNTRNLQLRAVISQKGKPIAFYSIKLTYSQKRYTVTKKELLSTVKNLKDFRTILLGQILRIYTDNKNLKC